MCCYEYRSENLDCERPEFPRVILGNASSAWTVDKMSLVHICGKGATFLRVSEISLNRPPRAQQLTIASTSVNSPRKQSKNPKLVESNLFNLVVFFE